MSKSFDEICNTVLGEDINTALYENADPIQAFKDLAQQHKDPLKLGQAVIAHLATLQKPATTPPVTTPTTPANQTAQQTTPQQSGQNAANKTTTPTQPQQGTQPTK